MEDSLETGIQDGENQPKRKEQENKVTKSPPSKKSKYQRESCQEYSNISTMKEKILQKHGDSEAKSLEEKEFLDNACKEKINEDTNSKDIEHRRKNVLSVSSKNQICKEDNLQEDFKLGLPNAQPKVGQEENYSKASFLEKKDLQESFSLGMNLEDSFLEKTNDNMHEPECSDLQTKGKQKKKKRNRRDKKQDNSEDGSSRQKLRPNYFVAVKISNSDIHQAIIKVQDSIIAVEPKLSRALVDVATSHITLMIARLESDDAFNIALGALEECKERFSQYKTDPVKLNFKGIDHFRNQVVYAKLVEDEQYQRLLSLATEVRQIFSDKGVCMPNEKELNPHLTIAKMSKTTHRKGKNFPRKIDPVCYKLHQDIQFGSQTVMGLQLLSMNDPKDENRYYHCAKAIEFDFKQSENDDHSQCCFPRKPVHTAEQKEEDEKTAESRFMLPLTAIMTCAAAVALVVVISRLRSRM